MTSSAFSGGRVAGALASSVFSQAINVAQTYLLVPLFLAAWGSEGYGHWLSLTALASYVALAELGGQAHVGNRLAEAFAQNRSADFVAMLRRGFTVFSALGVVALLVMGAVLLSLGGWDRSSRLVVLFVAAAAALGVPGGVLVSCYAATGRVVRGTTVGNATRLFGLGACFGALASRVSAPEFAIVTLCVGVFGTGLVIFDLRRQIPELFRPRLSAAALSDALPLLRASMPYWVFALSGALSLQGVLLILSATTDAATVAAYSTHRSAASLILYAGSLLRPALWTELTFMAARADFARIRQVVSIAVRSSTWFAAVAGSAICLAAPFGYALWTRSKLQLDVPLLVLLAGQAVLTASWSAAAWPLMSASRPRILARWSLLNGALTVLGGYVCLRLGWQLRGLAAWSIAVDVVCGLIPFPIAASAFMQGSVGSFFRDLARAVACALPFALLAFGCLTFLHDNPARLLGFGLGACVLAWPSLLLLYGARDFQRILLALRRAVSRSYRAMRAD